MTATMEREPTTATPTVDRHRPEIAAPPEAMQMYRRRVRRAGRWSLLALLLILGALAAVAAAADAGDAPATEGVTTVDVEPVDPAVKPTMREKPAGTSEPRSGTAAGTTGGGETEPACARLPWSPLFCAGKTP